jgi:thiol-disulfide isomerase/thioredoxin
MQTGKRLNRLVAGTFFLSVMVVAVDAQNNITSAELEEFKCVLYSDKILFPFENLVTLAGTPFDPVTIRGKYVLVNLWATWCPYCTRERPSLQKLYDRYEGGTFTVLGISLGEEPATVQGYMDSGGYSFPVIVNRDNALRASHAPRIPKTYIIDPEGYILAVISDNQEWDGSQAEKILRYLMPEIWQGKQ